MNPHAGGEHPRLILMGHYHNGPNKVHSLRIAPPHSLVLLRNNPWRGDARAVEFAWGRLRHEPARNGVGSPVQAVLISMRSMRISVTRYADLPAMDRDLGAKHPEVRPTDADLAYKRP